MAFAVKQKWKLTVGHPLGGLTALAPVDWPHIPYVQPAPLATPVGGALSVDFHIEQGFVLQGAQSFFNLQTGNGNLKSPASVTVICTPESANQPSLAVDPAYAQFWFSSKPAWDYDYSEEESLRADDFKAQMINLTGVAPNLDFARVSWPDRTGGSLQPGAFSGLITSLVGKMRESIINSGSEVGDAKDFSNGSRWHSSGSIAKLRGAGPQSRAIDVIVRDTGSAITLLDGDTYKAELEVEVQRLRSYRASMAKWASNPVGAKPTYTMVTSKWTEVDAGLLQKEADAISAAYTGVSDFLASPEGKTAEQEAYDKYVAAGGALPKEDWRNLYLTEAATAADGTLATTGSGSGFLDALKGTGNWLVDVFGKFTNALGDTGSTILGAGIASKVTGVSEYFPLILLGLGIVLVLK